MKHALARPAAYQFYQQLGGFFSARVKAISEYLPITPTSRVIDIGCGPGHIVQHLPETIDYVGLDVDADSIAFARRYFRTRGSFEVRRFDADAARELGPADIVMMNGVMHHIPDGELSDTLAIITGALKPGGRLFTLDGAYRAGQSRIDKWLLDNDRGAYVRTADDYRRLVAAHFADVRMHVRTDLSRVPYTFAIGVARAAA